MSRTYVRGDGDSRRMFEVCDQCGYFLDGARNCPYCGEPQCPECGCLCPQAMDDLMESLLEDEDDLPRFADA